MSKSFDVSHVYGLEVFFDDVDTLRVCLPTDCQYWVNVQRSKSKTRCPNAVEEAEVYKGQLLCKHMCNVSYPDGLLRPRRLGGKVFGLTWVFRPRRLGGKVVW